MALASSSWSSAGSSRHVLSPAADHVDQWLAAPDATAAVVLETEAASAAGSPS